MTARLTRFLAGARQAGLTLGAVVGAVCLLLTVGALVLDARPLVFRSGSMSPTIDTGALAIAHRVDAGSLEVGQVVSVPTPTGERVTHRIQSVEHDGGSAVLQLKGDANQAADPAPYVVTHADKVLFAVPWLGYVLGWLTGPLGLFFLGLYAAFLLSVVVRPNGGRTGPPTSRGATPVPALVLVLGAGLVSGTVLQARTTPTLAAWTDPASVSGTAMTAYTVPAPPNTTCVVATPGSTSSRGVDVSWPTVTAVPLSYTVAATGVATTTSLSSASGTTTVGVRYNPSASPADTMVTVTAVAYPSAASSWTAPTSTWQFVTGHNQSSQPVCQEVDQPVLVVTAPTGTTTTAAATATEVSSSCGKKRMVCGTVTDASTITGVEFILQRGTQCWQDGSSTYTSNCTTWQSATQAGGQWFNAQGSNNLSSIAFPSGAASYVLTVRATDFWGNVRTVTRTFSTTS